MAVQGCRLPRGHRRGCYSLTEIPRGEFDTIGAGPINNSGQVAGLRAM